jgi:hypothetical protein
MGTTKEASNAPEISASHAGRSIDRMFSCAAGVCAVAAAFAALVSVSEARADGFSYIDFGTPSQLIFQADAAPTNGVCRLTPSINHKSGGVWFQNGLAVGDGFETTFQFQITGPQKYGADGFAFVVQGNPTPSLGKAGWQIGFGGIPNSLVVKFDNYHWRDKVYEKYDEIAVSVCGESGDCDSENNAIASVTKDVRFSDGKIHTARILYRSGVLQVCLDDFHEAVLRTQVELPNSLKSPRREAWVGFTAATGADYQTHDILNWTLFTGSVPGAGPPPVISDRSATFEHAAEANRRTVTAASSPVTQPAAVFKSVASVLGRGPFMLKMPAASALPFQIEASTNLVDWVSVTNVTLYFQDPDSTQFNHRFYRVSER